MKPKVSIITVNFNGEKFLKEFFASIKRLNYRNWELIFFDNASKDKSVEYVKKNHSEIKVMASQENLGFVLANNQTAKKAKGKYLFFLNYDTKVDSQLVSLLVEKMEEDKEVGICGCRIMSYDGERQFHTGIGIDVLGYPVVAKKVFYIEGSALMIRKALFEKLGGFDPKYFMFHEDIDLAWRAQLLGYKIVALPKAIVYHFGGASAAGGEKVKGKYRSSFLRRYYSERNNIRTLLKNYQLPTLMIILFFYFLLNLGEIFLYLALFNFKLVYFYFKVYLWNLVNLKNTLKERAKIQRARIVSDRELMKRMSWGSGKILAFKKAGIPEFK